MHVVMLSDAESIGGAAAAANRLAEGLVHAGARVTRIVWYADNNPHPWNTIRLRRFPAERMVWEVWKLIAKKVPLQVSQYVQKVWFHRRLQSILERIRPDIINVHNLHAAGWFPAIVSVCAERAPVVWTMQDMWSFTGRCAYAYDCRKFIQGCDHLCPTPEEYPSFSPQRIRDAWSQRQRLFVSHPEMTAVAPSRWLASEALQGLWRGHRVEVIPNGIPLESYKPGDRKAARASLSLKTQGPVLLMAAQNLCERRKGGELLVEALEKVAHRPITLITMGEGKLPVKSGDISLYPLDGAAGFSAEAAGHVDQEEKRALAYSGADLFVHPAPVDNLPNVVMEAIACGTPVVGFPIGGIPDMVRPGKTGWLAEAVTPETLASALEAAIRDLGAGIDLRSSCRSVAEAEYGIELQARRYLELFHSLEPQKRTDGKRIITG